MQNRNTIRTALIALAIAGSLTLLAGLGVLKRLDLAASDALYQQREATDGQILLINIDQRALESIGPYSQWGRDVLASVIDTLNQSEDCRPAAIGVDVLFAGETRPELDRQLVEAAGRYGNVVVACAAQFGNALAESEGEYYIEDFSLLAFEQPFEALRQATAQGHINAMMDGDGILRHHMLCLTLPDGTQVPSMALAVADCYRAYYGQEPVDRPPTNDRGFWYLPFCGRPGDMDSSISVADILDGTIPADYFAGKIVLIGPYVPALQDSYFTAADHARPMYGVEIHANAIQAMLWGDHPTEAGDGVQLAVLFFLLLAGLAAFWRRPVWSSTVVWLLMAGGWLPVCLAVCSWAGLLLHVLWVPVGITILYGGSLAFNYIRAAMEKQQTIKVFGRYVSKEIVDEILKDPEAKNTGGKLVDIAVLFVDIRGFTSMSEKMETEGNDGPKRLVGFLNRYLETITQCVWDNGGTVDKFVGDEVMAFWGAPVKQEDPAMCAAKAAVAMTSKMDRLSRELEAEFGYPVSYGVGIHLGPAVVGNVGFKQHMDYTAIGDTVNTAARLQSIAGPGVIHISRSMLDALGGRVCAGSPRWVGLKGKQDRVQVWELKEILSEQ